jgi:DNA-binding CsgD family transcriptional regulator
MTLGTPGARDQGGLMVEDNKGICSDTAAEPQAFSTQHYQGPERRVAGHDSVGWLTRMLDEIDYGMLLVTADAKVTYLNHAARLELDGQHPLQLSDRRLGANSPPDLAPLYEALADAQRGLRRLLTLGAGRQQVSISVVPLHDTAQAGDSHTCRTNDSPSAVTLLVLGKRQVCEQLSVQGFARSHHLTPAETRVLEGLCGGLRPSTIAADAGVAVSTVRTQIGSIRAKTGASSIRELARRVAVLPPLVGALRGTAGAAGGLGAAQRPHVGARAARHAAGASAPSA